MQSDMHSPVSSSIHDDSVPWVSSNDAETRMAKSGKSETVACVLIWTGKGGTATHKSIPSRSWKVSSEEYPIRLLPERQRDLNGDRTIGLGIVLYLNPDMTIECFKVLPIRST